MFTTIIRINIVICYSLMICTQRNTDPCSILPAVKIIHMAMISSIKVYSHFYDGRHYHNPDAKATTACFCATFIMVRLCGIKFMRHHFKFTISFIKQSRKLPGRTLRTKYSVDKGRFTQSVIRGRFPHIHLYFVNPSPVSSKM